MSVVQVELMHRATTRFYSDMILVSVRSLLVYKDDILHSETLHSVLQSAP